MTGLVYLSIVTLLLFFLVVLLLSRLFLQRKRILNHQGLLLLQKNQLIEAAVRSEEKDRCSIAEELHDEVGAILSSCKLHFQMLKLNKADIVSQQVYGKGIELLNEATEIIRRMSHTLHSNVLQEFGFNHAVKHFLNILTSNQVVSVSTAMDDNFHLSAGNNVIIYRIIQELVQNIMKHAFASKIHISSLYEQDKYQLSITHNGIGLTQSEFEELSFSDQSLGLKNILNRVLILQGTLVFLKAEGSYNIILVIPARK